MVVHRMALCLAMMATCRRPLRQPLPRTLLLRPLLEPSDEKARTSPLEVSVERAAKASGRPMGTPKGRVHLKIAPIPWPSWSRACFCPVAFLEEALLPWRTFLTRTSRRTWRVHTAHPRPTTRGSPPGSTRSCPRTAPCRRMPLLARRLRGSPWTCLGHHRRVTLASDALGSRGCLYH